MGEVNSAQTSIHLHLRKHLQQREQKLRTRVLRLNPSDRIQLIQNDYHGFSQLPLKSNAPSGAGGSRLLGGNGPAHIELERFLASALHQEGGLIFPSGYQCHLSVLTTLVESGAFTPISDHLNHTCLVEGLRSHPGYRYRHQDLEDCHKKILAAKHRNPEKTPLVILESLHSMDGSVADLQTLLQIKTETGAWLVMDEAHAVGVCGKHGLGLADEHGMTQQIDVILGTFSKGLGLQGAFVASQSLVIEYLTNFAKGFIYTTGLSPALAETAHHRLHQLIREPLHIQRLRRRIGEFMSLTQVFRHHSPLSPIFQIPFEHETHLFSAHEWLEKNGVITGCIRPPTYPHPMLRVCVHSYGSEETWEGILRIFQTFFTLFPMVPYGSKTLRHSRNWN